MKHTMKTLLGVLLALTKICGLLPGMLSTAHAVWGYCPYCGSTNYLWDSMLGCYTCSNCWEDFDEPSSTPPVHHHGWVYDSYFGNSVEAECSAEYCPNGYNENEITLTIIPPANLVCDGSAKTASISGSVPDGLGLPSPSGITYNAGDSNASTEPGSYIASFTWGGKSASVNFTLTAPHTPIPGAIRPAAPP